MNKDIQMIRKAIDQTRKPQLFYMLIPLSWGFWNVLASLCSMAVTSQSIGLVWGIMMICGLTTQILLFKGFKLKSGFMLKSVSDIGKIWLIILAAIFVGVFGIDMISNGIIGIYSMAIVSLFVGVGLSATGILSKQLVFVLAGLIWIASSLLHALYPEMTYIIHLCVSGVSLILLPVGLYVIKLNLHAGNE